MNSIVRNKVKNKGKLFNKHQYNNILYREKYMEDWLMEKNL